MVVVFVCTCLRLFICLQDKNPYSSVPDAAELDRRYCVLKLHVPYSDLMTPPDTHTDWGAHCQMDKCYNY